MQGKVPSMRDYRNFVQQLQQTMKGKLHISDASRGRVSSLTVASQIERNKPDIVFVDYLGLMSRGPDWQGMAVLTGELKQIAVEYGVPIVVASQLNRENGLGKEPPGAEALALSDAVGQDADMVITMKLQSKSVLKMRMAKNRNGGGDHRWYMQFQPGDGIIKEISANKAIELSDKDKEDQVMAI
jgi:replicative DNA helicase